VSRTPEFSALFDYEKILADPARAHDPIFFTGEMIFREYTPAACMI
jgi:hypothetical protein